MQISSQIVMSHYVTHCNSSSWKLKDGVIEGSSLTDISDYTSKLHHSHWMGCFLQQLSHITILNYHAINLSFDV